MAGPKDAGAPDREHDLSDMDGWADDLLDENEREPDIYDEDYTASPGVEQSVAAGAEVRLGLTRDDPLRSGEGPPKMLHLYLSPDGDLLRITTERGVARLRTVTPEEIAVGQARLRDLVHPALNGLPRGQC